MQQLCDDNVGSRNSFDVGVVVVVVVVASPHFVCKKDVRKVTNSARDMFSQVLYTKRNAQSKSAAPFHLYICVHVRASFTECSYMLGC